jgi:hypothetical protein
MSIGSHLPQADPFSLVPTFKLQFSALKLFVITIAGHRHRGQCRRHRNSGIRHLSPVPEHSGTGMDPLIPELTVPGIVILIHSGI